MAKRTDWSPLKATREELGLSRADLAALAGLGYRQIYEIEAGYTVGFPVKLKDALAVMGVDAADVEQQHKMWIERRAAMLRTRFAVADR